MNTTLTEISNILNLMVQADSRLKFYHFGWRSDINKNIDNNFDKGVKTGRLFPALHFDVPDFFQPSEELNFLGFREDIAVNLYFDDLQNYDNTGEQKTDNLIEQWTNLKQIADDFISNLAEVLEYYKAGFIRTVPRFEPKSNLFNDKLITFEVSFTIAHTAKCTEVSNKINPAALPVSDCNFRYDLENYIRYTDCKSLLLDGVNEYIDCTNNAVFNQDFNTPFSSSVWIKADSFVGVDLIISKFNLSPKGWQLRIDNQKIGLLLKESSGTPNQILAIGSTVLNVAEWYHVAATYDGSNALGGVKLYINGISETVTGSGGSVTGTFQNSDPMQIGGQSGANFNGNIASARVWKSELSPAEIIEEYNSGNIKNIPVNTNNIIINSDFKCAFWNGTAFEIPDLTGITAGYISVNSEEADLLTDCP